MYFPQETLRVRSFFDDIKLGDSFLSDSKMTVIKIAAIVGYHKMEYSGQIEPVKHQKTGRE